MSRLDRAKQQLEHVILMTPFAEERTLTHYPLGLNLPRPLYAMLGSGCTHSLQQWRPPALSPCPLFRHEVNAIQDHMRTTKSEQGRTGSSFGSETLNFIADSLQNPVLCQPFRIDRTRNTHNEAGSIYGEYGEMSFCHLLALRIRMIRYTTIHMYSLEEIVDYQPKLITMNLLQFVGFCWTVAGRDHHSLIDAIRIIQRQRRHWHPNCKTKNL